MPFDSEVCLLGTGLAPLAAAYQLVSQGRKVLLLNPEWDFFAEDSELPLDPLWPAGGVTFRPERLQRSLPDRMLRELRPVFPGAIEPWPAPSHRGFHDAFAPHVRSRSWLWIRSKRSSQLKDWEDLEDMYVEGGDAGLNPSLLDGLPAVMRFPGASPRLLKAEGDAYRGLMVPRLGDVDVSRFRYGVLEFLRERISPDRIITGVSQIQPIPEGVRFHAGGAPGTARLTDGMIVFWTPRLTSWVMSQARALEAPLVQPKGVRLWEEWSLISREDLDPSMVGIFEDMAVWAKIEGAPENERNERRKHDRLSVLRPGPLVAAESFNAAFSSSVWASTESFRALSRLFQDFLRWEHFSVRRLRPRAIFEWDREVFIQNLGQMQLVCGCDGPIVETVRSARMACERIEGG